MFLFDRGKVMTNLYRVMFICSLVYNSASLAQRYEPAEMLCGKLRQEKTLTVEHSMDSLLFFRLQPKDLDSDKPILDENLKEALEENNGGRPVVRYSKEIFSDDWKIVSAVTKNQGIWVYYNINFVQSTSCVSTQPVVEKDRRGFYLKEKVSGEPTGLFDAPLYDNYGKCAYIVKLCRKIEVP